MPHFEIAYWPLHGPPWRRFTSVEAPSAREAIEAVGPRAVGRYRVTLVESEETKGLFRVEVDENRYELVEVAAFHAGVQAREAAADRAADAAAHPGLRVQSDSE